MNAMNAGSAVKGVVGRWKRAINEKEASENAMKANGAFSPRQTNASNETKQPAEEQFDMLKRRKLLFEDDSSSDESSDIEMSD